MATTSPFGRKLLRDLLKQLAAIRLRLVQRLPGALAELVQCRGSRNVRIVPADHGIYFSPCACVLIIADRRIYFRLRACGISLVARRICFSLRGTHAERDSEFLATLEYRLGQIIKLGTVFQGAANGYRQG